MSVGLNRNDKVRIAKETLAACEARAYTNAAGARVDRVRSRGHRVSDDRVPAWTQAGATSTTRIARPRSRPAPYEDRISSANIGRRRLNEQLLVNVLGASDIAVYAAGIELMRELPVDLFSALPLQSLATFALGMRRRLAYTASFSACLPSQWRAPRSGSAM